MLELLKARKFSTVVVIDDENALPPMDSIEQIAKELVDAKNRARNRLCDELPDLAEACKLAAPVNGDGPDSQARQASVRAWLQDHEELLTAELRRKVSAVLFQGVTGQTHDKLRKELKDEALTLQAYSFAEWQESSSKVLNEATADARVLLLVDELNTKETHVDLDGQRVLRDVMRDAGGKLPFIDAIMVTSNCEPSQEIEKSHSLYVEVCDLLKKQGLEPTFKKVFVLSKARLDDHSFVENFTQYMNRIEASRLSIELADVTKEVLSSALAESLDWLKTIPFMEFHHSIFVTAQTEGAAEIDTLVRLASIRQRAALDRLFRENGRVQACIEEMRSISEDDLGGKLSATSSALRELREQEFERPGSHINLLRAPLANGDVFRFITRDVKGEQQEFSAMLLVNPCDLVLRADGTRKLSTGLLVQVQKVPRRAAEAEKALPPLTYRLATGGQPEDVTYVFQNSKVESIPLYILDLCWTNERGVAEFHPSKGALASLAAPQRSRAEILAHRAEGGRFTHVELWGTDLRQETLDAPPLQIGGVQLTKKVHYTAFREWRLAPEFAAAALSALSQALARPAFGHDYLQP